MPRYPPFMEGLPATPVEMILAQQQPLIDALDQALGNRELFAEHLLPLIGRYAAFVHHLPASETYHHRGAGGLFRHGLEVAFRAAREARGVMFVSAWTDPEVKNRRNFVWIFGTVVAALLHDIGKPCTDMQVASRDGSARWDPYLGPLYDWLTAEGIERYHLRWVPGRQRRHQYAGAAVLDQFLTPALRSFLAREESGVLQEVLFSVSGGTSEPSRLHSVVTAADSGSTAEDMARSMERDGDYRYSAPTEQIAVNLMSQFVQEGRWRCNQPGSKVWCIGGAVFVVWPEGWREVLPELSRRRIPLLDRSPLGMARQMIDREIACPLVSPDDDAYPLWRIAPSCLGGVSLTALRLKSASLLFGMPPESVEGEILSPEPSGRGAAATQPPAGRASAGAGSMPDFHTPSEPRSGGAGGNPPAAGDRPPTDRPPQNPPSRPPGQGGGQGESPPTDAGQPSRAGQRTPPEPNPRIEAERFFERRGAGGALLLALARRLEEAPEAWPEIGMRHNDRVCLFHRLWETAVTVPADQKAYALLDAEGLIEPDPENPARKAQVIVPGRRPVLVLSAEAGAALLAIAGESPQLGAVREPPLASGAPQSGGAASEGGSDAKTGHDRNPRPGGSGSDASPRGGGSGPSPASRPAQTRPPIVPEPPDPARVFGQAGEGGRLVLALARGIAAGRISREGLVRSHRKRVALIHPDWMDAIGAQRIGVVGRLRDAQLIERDPDVAARWVQRPDPQGPGLLVLSEGAGKAFEQLCAPASSEDAEGAAQSGEARPEDVPPEKAPTHAGDPPEPDPSPTRNDPSPQRTPAGAAPSRPETESVPDSPEELSTLEGEELVRLVRALIASPDSGLEFESDDEAYLVMGASLAEYCARITGVSPVVMRQRLLALPGVRSLRVRSIEMLVMEKRTYG